MSILTFYPVVQVLKFCFTNSFLTSPVGPPQGMYGGIISSPSSPAVQMGAMSPANNNGYSLPIYQTQNPATSPMPMMPSNPMDTCQSEDNLNLNEAMDEIAE